MQEESLDRNFGLILHDVARLLRTNFDRRVRDLGLTRSQWWVLTHLYREDGLTQTELAELMEIERPSLGRLLDRLEAKNWIRRGNDPSDRRVNRVYLTVDVKPMVREMRQPRYSPHAWCQWTRGPGASEPRLHRPSVAGVLGPTGTICCLA